MGWGSTGIKWRISIPRFGAGGVVVWRSSESQSTTGISLSSRGVARGSVPSGEAVGRVGCGGAIPGALIGERTDPLPGASSFTRSSRLTPRTGGFSDASADVVTIWERASLPFCCGVDERKLLPPE